MADFSVIFNFSSCIISRNSVALRVTECWLTKWSIFLKQQMFFLTRCRWLVGESLGAGILIRAMWSFESEYCVIENLYDPAGYSLLSFTIKTYIDLIISFHDWWGIINQGMALFMRITMDYRFHFHHFNIGKEVSI